MERNWGTSLYSRTHSLPNPISQHAFVMTLDPQEGHLENDWVRTAYLPDSLATITGSEVSVSSKQLLSDKPLRITWFGMSWPG